MFKLTKGSPVFVEPAKIEPELGIKEGEDVHYVISNKEKYVLMYGGMSYGVKTLTFPQKFFLLKRTKLLKSKSKQSRMVSVVCK